MVTIEINETLVVEVMTGHDVYLTIGRVDGGLVRVEPGELRDLVHGLVRAAELLARAAAKEAQR